MRRYGNDAVYATYEFEDETSQFDPRGRWCPGDEYYEATYRVRVPRKMLEKAEKDNDFDAVVNWIDENTHQPIWLD